MWRRENGDERDSVMADFNADSITIWSGDERDSVMPNVTASGFWIRQDIPWEPFLRDLQDLEQFVDLRLDLVPDSDRNKCRIDIYKARPDMICVALRSQRPVLGQSPLDLFLKRTCEVVQHLIRNYGSAEHRVRTTRG